MVAYNFGVGVWIAKRTDVTLQVPTLLGVLQDLELDIDRTLKELVGNYALPVDVAQAQMKITGKGKFAQMSAGNINNTILGQTQVSNSGFQVASPENWVPAATLLTVSHATTFSEDLGVRYHSTGNPLTPVSASPTIAQYIPGVAATGVYSLNTLDISASLDIYYSYTVSTMTQINAANQLMGVGTTFELVGSNSYNVCGVVKYLSVKLNQCKAAKIGLPMKNMDYTIFDLEFQAFADCSNHWGTIAFTDA